LSVKLQLNALITQFFNVDIYKYLLGYY